MSKLPTFDHNPAERTVVVTHYGSTIRDYAEVRAGQLTALLSIIGACTLDGDHGDVVTSRLLAEELACEVSGLVEMFTRTDCLEVSHG